MPRASAALLAALLLTAANALKPLVIDDTVYVAFAQQIARHPTDPYGFELYWYEAPEPAMGIGTVPGVLPYWLAGAMTLFGDQPWAWKLSLLPFALALTGSLAFLLSRVAPPFATPLLFAIALGPTLLPGFNLMQDVPACALGLLAYALFVAACERRDARIALACGVALGLALQTKYAAILAPGLVLAHAVIYRRPREGAIALATGAALFVEWETWLVARYGQSHFLAGIERLRSMELLPAVTRAAAEIPGAPAIYWTLSLLSLSGAVIGGAGLLALAGLGVRRSRVALAALVAAAGFGVVALLPQPLYDGQSFFGRVFAYHPSLFVFLSLGIGVAAAVALVAARGLRRGASPDPRQDRVLAAWLALEVVGFFVISPYPAVRRVIGLSVVAWLLGARAAALRADAGEARAGVRIATLFGLALGVLYFASDLADARAHRDLVAHADARLTSLGADRERETVWFIGHWSFQFYAERAGMRQVVAGRSLLKPNDWMLVPEHTPRAPLSFPKGSFWSVEQVAATSASPWSTISLYYDGPTPLSRQPEALENVRILRVMRELVPSLQGSP